MLERYCLPPMLPKNNPSPNSTSSTPIGVTVECDEFSLVCQSRIRSRHHTLLGFPRPSTGKRSDSRDLLEEVDMWAVRKPKGTGRCPVLGSVGIVPFEA